MSTAMRSCLIRSTVIRSRRVGEARPSNANAGSMVLVGALVAFNFVAFTVTPPLLGADVSSLLRSYKESKVKLRGTPKKDQEKFVEETILPILIEIARVGDSASTKALEAEYVAVTDVLSIACAKALLESPDEEALAAIFSNLPHIYLQFPINYSKAAR